MRANTLRKAPLMFNWIWLLFKVPKKVNYLKYNSILISTVVESLMIYFETCSHTEVCDPSLLWAVSHKLPRHTCRSQWKIPPPAPRRNWVKCSSQAGFGISSAPPLFTFMFGLIWWTDSVSACLTNSTPRLQGNIQHVWLN